MIYSVPGVYSVKNKVTGFAYIGSSNDVFKRIYVHRSLLRNNHSHSRKLQEAWNIYGEDNFQFSVLHIVWTYEDLFKEELKEILDAELLYNEIVPSFKYVIRVGEINKHDRYVLEFVRGYNTNQLKDILNRALDDRSILDCIKVKLGSLSHV